MQLIIASTNVHKVREYRAMLKSLCSFDVFSLIDFPHFTPQEERGETFEEIATQKALMAAKALGKLVLADDSGLVVPALGGSPGIFSARYAGIEASDKDNRKKLLSEMKDLDETQRHAYLECCIVIAGPDGIKKISKGICEGSIVSDERGSAGFGYDSVFMKHDYSKTFAELDEEIKNRISHRRKAFDKLKTTFETLVEEALSHRRI